MLMNDLHQFILSLNLFAAEQMQSDVDTFKITPALRKTDVPGELLIFEKDYTAIFSIERFPYQQVSEDELLAQICAWLHQQTDFWKVSQFSIDLIIDILDSYTADLDFSLDLTENVIATEAADGSILFNGLRYAL